MPTQFLPVPVRLIRPGWSVLPTTTRDLTAWPGLARALRAKYGRTLIWAAAMGLALASTLPAAEMLVPGLPTPTNTAFTEIRPGIFELGGILLDQKKRAVSFRAAVNLREGPVEYVVVTTQGKIHESLLRTDIAPQQLHVAMLLLGAKGVGTNRWPENSSHAMPGERVTIEMSWTEGKRTRRAPVGTFVLDRKAKRPLKKPDWTYTGSRLRDDGFAAQQDGSIVSLIADPDALINSAAPGRDDDDNWLAHPKGLPPAETVVEVTVRLLH